ncbi:class II aldolase/adducin family protein [Conexibacter sp. JD483]|uniref:class II aldolase/adducin family protein n=1 Tax=unclassified Conexibacter TaxID=2627773 RepID=UPI0027159C6E|nr:MULTISPECIES: class II aldolase/adducin family protein [unclassified Conexibacter]MDO8188706.1 class II aldolase/adducin family protein [Conexibacter sp. CPCC 205706]MDO8201572.1 class II aldolase/adducin family protein [Conexibacter sp. CPCC 205762]MDR9371663.1 class II aldolase/adducin family protein [Conexibacter sp. JD483]
MSPQEEVARGCRVLGAAGLDDHVWGHLSLRDGDGRGAWIKRAGIAFDEVTVDDVMLVGWEGEVVAGDGPRHQEWPIHTEALLARPATQAVVHAHPPHAIALAAAGREPLAISHTGGVFAAGVGRYEEWAGLIDTRERGASLAAALAGHRAALMVGHGVVTAGASVGLAVTAAVLLEQACELTLLADAAGGVVRPLPRERALAEYAHAQADAHLEGAWRRLLRAVA